MRHHLFNFTENLVASHSQRVLLASFVLTIGLLATLGLITYSYQNSGATQDLIIASELAQEGVEIARNIRDNAIATGAKGDAGANRVFRNFPDTDAAGANPNTRCRWGYAYPIPAGPGPAINCGAGQPYNLYLIANNVYSYNPAGPMTRYKRILRIIHQSNSGQARVVSFVTWGSSPVNLDTNPLANLIAACTTKDQCVYTELFLTAWK